MTAAATIPETPGGFRGPQVCALVGITYRMLDYWARTELVRPSIADARGSGTQRRYSAGDVRKLRLVKRLLDIGHDLTAARRALPLLDQAADDECRWLVLDSGGPHVVAGGRLEQLLDEDRVDIATIIDLHSLGSTP